MMSTVEKKQPTYIDDQAWSLLSEFDDPWPHLAASRLRAGRPNRGAIPGNDSTNSDPWAEVERDSIVEGTVQWDRDHVDTRRMVITTDAGIGKSSATKWLTYRINASANRHLAFRLTVRDLCSRDGRVGGRNEELNERLIAFLALRLSEVQSDQTSRLVRRKRSAGQLTLILDELDHATGDLARLEQLVDSPIWAKTRIIIAGRPSSLRRCKNGALKDKRWRFVRLEEFTDEQIDHYLGETETGGRRFKELPDEARPILGIPRVLQYLRELSDDRLRSMKSVADIYYAAVDHLLRETFAGSPDARLLGYSGNTPPPTTHRANLKSAWHLLGAIAYVMTYQTISKADDQNGSDQDSSDEAVKRVPNFDRMPSADCDIDDVDDFLNLVKQRYASPSKNGFDQDETALAYLDQFLEPDISLLENAIAGLESYQFRNRSLQEFLCAHFLSRHATVDRVEGIDDPAQLWDWIYLPLEPDTEEYYYIW